MAESACLPLSVSLYDAYVIAFFYKFLCVLWQPEIMSPDCVLSNVAWNGQCIAMRFVAPAIGPIFQRADDPALFLGTLKCMIHCLYRNVRTIGQFSLAGEDILTVLITVS